MGQGVFSECGHYLIDRAEDSALIRDHTIQGVSE
jgi:hypothetical protein